MSSTINLHVRASDYASSSRVFFGTRLIIICPPCERHRMMIVMRPLVVVSLVSDIT